MRWGCWPVVLVGALVLPEVGAFAAQREDATKHIIYSLGRQRVWLMEGKPFRVLDTYKVSGRTDIPAPGRYSVYSRSPRAWSTISIGVEWNWMIRFAYSPKGLPDRLSRDPRAQGRREVGAAAIGGRARHQALVGLRASGTGQGAVPLEVGAHRDPRHRHALRAAQAAYFDVCGRRARAPGRSLRARDARPHRTCSAAGRRERG
jgi:hypothetical protein